MVAARYGHLAAPCQLLMDDGNLTVMFHSMAKRAEQIYLNDDTALSEEAMYVIVGCADACCFSWHSHFILRSGTSHTIVMLNDARCKPSPLRQAPYPSF